MNIPEFPNLRKLELADKYFIETYNSSFPPYSDFNFTSLWSWNTHEKTAISILDGTLIILFWDYTNPEIGFFSFLSDKDEFGTVKTMTSYAVNQGLSPYLKLVPDCFIYNSEFQKHYSVRDDRDNFDYILSTYDTVLLRGQSNRSKRYDVKRFVELHKPTVNKLELTKQETQRQIESIFHEWERGKEKGKNETEHELLALRRLLDASAQFNVESMGVFIGNDLVGFIIFEVIKHDYAIIHFEKIPTSFSGGFPFLKNQMAIYLLENGCKYVNYEQDLGLVGLRRAKQSYHPVGFLKKVIISPISD